MPGIDARAPERTDSSSGSAASPNVLPISCSTKATPCSTSASISFERVLLALLGEDGAGLGADGEARGHGDAQAAHLGQVGALAAEQVLHRRRALGARGAEQIDVLGACGHA